MAKGYPDFEGNKSKLFLVPEWAAKEGTDKNFSVQADDKPHSQAAVITYAVPAAKTLYLIMCSFALVPGTGGSAANLQLGYCYIYDNTASVDYLWLGGIGGNGLNFTKPIVIPGGDTVKMELWNYSGNNSHVGLVVLGYEV